MKSKRIALGGFSRVSDDELLVRAGTICQAMGGSPYFANNAAILSDLELSVDLFRQHLEICRKKGSPLDTANKNASRETVAGILQQLAALVTRTAQGDLQKLLSSGFPLSSPGKAREFPEVVTYVSLSEGKQSGQLRLDFEKASHALLYEYRYAEADGDMAGEWSEPLMTTSSRGNIIAPLTPFVRHYVQVRGVNAYGRSEWSNTVSYIIR